MNIVIEQIGFNQIDVTTKVSVDAEFSCREIDVNYAAFIGQKHELRGTLKMPATDCLCLSEIRRNIKEHIKNS